MPDQEFCTFRWRDKVGDHRCDDFRAHDEHHCCCGATMQPAAPAKRARSRRNR